MVWCVTYVVNPIVLFSPFCRHFGYLKGSSISSFFFFSTQTSDSKWYLSWDDSSIFTFYGSSMYFFLCGFPSHYCSEVSHVKGNCSTFSLLFSFLYLPCREMDFKDRYLFDCKFTTSCPFSFFWTNNFNRNNLYAMSLCLCFYPNRLPVGTVLRTGLCKTYNSMENRRSGTTSLLREEEWDWRYPDKCFCDSNFTPSHSTRNTVFLCSDKLLLSVSKSICKVQ